MNKLCEMENNILVTGGTGLVGKNLKLYIETLERKENRWIFAGTKDADLRNVGETFQLFQRYKPVYVIHLAADVGGLYKNAKNNDTILEDNLLINLNVLKAAKTFAVTKVVSMLSTCVFAESCSLPLLEEKLHKGMPHPTNIGFAISKRMIDILNRIYANEKTKYLSVIGCNTFGPYDNFSLEDGHCIGALIHKFYLAKLREDSSITIMGTGTPKRQFIYAKDLGKLIVWALNNYEDPEPIIMSVSEQEEISIKDLAEKIGKIMKYDGQIMFDTNKADGVYRKPASNQKLLKFYPNVQFTPFECALEETVHWFIENYDSLRK